MRKAFLLLLFPLLTTSLCAQDKAGAEKLVNEGVLYHDKGDYTGAVAKYDKALELDVNNLLALAEKAYSLMAQNKLEESIESCQKAIETHPGESTLKMVYVTYGTALEGLKMTDKSIAMYDEGINLFPDSYELSFNKGITLATANRYDEAILCFQQAITIHPKHTSSHNALGRILMFQAKRIPAILVFTQFLILEPESKRAAENLARLQKLMKSNVEKTGKESVTLSISADVLKDAGSDTPQDDNFATIDMVLSLASALDYDKKYKNKTDVEQFIRKFESMCSTLQEQQSKNSGFYWKHFVPYFIEMRDKKLTETCAYLLFASSPETYVAEWLKTHDTEINQFYAWSNAFQWKEH